MTDSADARSRPPSPQVISASYRTDIPAFYGDWFMERVREGYVRYYNPYGPQVVSVSLQPQDVHAIVFWSKNYAPFMRHLDELDQRGLDFYFHFGINGYTADPAIRPLEERVPHPKQSIKVFRELATRYSPKHVQWRYDPIIYTDRTDEQWHMRAFAELAQQLEGLTERCYFSFLDINYKKVVHNMRRLDTALQPHDRSEEEKRQLALELARIAGNHGITLYTCAEDFAVIGPIRRGACVDKDILDTLWPHKAQKLKLCSNRNKCGCYDSRDIGAYDTCPLGCVYCYAVLNRPLALQYYREHDPHHDALIKRGPKEPPAQLSTPVTAQDGSGRAEGDPKEPPAQPSAHQLELFGNDNTNNQ